MRALRVTASLLVELETRDWGGLSGGLSGAWCRDGGGGGSTSLGLLVWWLSHSRPGRCDMWSVCDGHHINFLLCKTIMTKVSD